MISSQLGEMFKLLPKWLLCYRPEVCFTITYQKVGD